MKHRTAISGVTSVALAMMSLATALVLPAQAAQPSVPAPSPGAMPSAVPSAVSPQVDDGDVRSIAQVGTTMVIGGNFTSVGGQARGRIAAFNAATGALTSFNLPVNGEVTTIVPGPDSHSVYIGGSFSQVGTTAAQALALVDLNTSSVVPSWKPPKFNSGVVNDIVSRGNRIYAVGTFAKAGGLPHSGIVALNATTGALDPFMNVQFTGHHNDTGSGAQGPVGPWNLDVTPDGRQMVVIGNFKQADGQLRDQVAQIDLTGTQAVVRADWATNRYSPYCYNWAFDSYVRGVSYSPDGSYFVVAATGGGVGDTLCDSAARFETKAVGTAVDPTWVDESGGDTNWAVTVTDTAIFVGGHQRWANNPYGSDNASPGAVPRPGLVALDPVSGRPLQWNPGRNPPGKAVYALLATSSGLWMGSNTDYVGNYKYKRQKIVFFPYAGGTPLASTATGSLPGTVFLGGSQSTGATNVLYRVNAGGGAIQSLDSGPDWAADATTTVRTATRERNAAGYDPGTRHRQHRAVDHAVGRVQLRALVAVRQPGHEVGVPGPGRQAGAGAPLLRQPVHLHQQRRVACLRCLDRRNQGAGQLRHRGLGRRPDGHDAELQRHQRRRRQHRLRPPHREPAGQRDRDRATRHPGPGGLGRGRALTRRLRRHHRDAR